MNSKLDAPHPSPADLIEFSPMKLRQWLVVAVCILLMALDGFDVMSISLAGAGIKEEWSLSDAQLGFLLPLEFIGMAVGAIFIGAFSDNFGRRLTILLCLLILTVGMAVSAIAPSLLVLAGSRVFTGIGIGGVLAGATALSSEYSNFKNRSLSVILIAAGYTVGIFLVSKIAGPILVKYDWRVIFQIGAFISLAFIPVFFLAVPESISFLERKNAPGTEEQIGSTLRKLGYSQKFSLRHDRTVMESTAMSELFKGNTARITYIMMICYLGNILTYYFFIKWMPPAVTALGYSKADGSEVLAMISLGGLIGSLAMAALLKFFALKHLMIVALFASAVSVGAFPFFTNSLSGMQVAGFIGGVCIFAAIGGFFALFAQSFPPRVLASGTGLVLGAGRGGAVIGPWAGGLMFGAGMSLLVVAPIMALGSAIAGCSLTLLRKRDP